ncbi:MAG: AgmX/PglI C-terminal domain-containing protein [Myxococcaceae bacterium]|nr:AgmX/PglI C-terminal domain-containing protein [Myxococcaceae bacterium]
MNASAPQALRIAIIHQGRIIEDRTLPPGKKARVTVGSDPKATFCVPMSESSGRTTVFEVTKTGAQLVAEPSLEGRIQLGGTERPLSEQPRAVPLSPGAKGRVKLQDVTVLFQLVTPPPAPPPMALPKGARGVVAQLDRSFVTILAVVFAAHFAAAGYVMAQPPPVDRELSLAELQHDRFAAVLMPLPKLEALVKKPVTPQPATKPTLTEPVAASKPVAAAAPKPSDRPSAQVMKERLSRLGMLAVIGAKGDGEGLVGDLLKDTSSVGSVTDAMRNADGFQVATAADALRADRKGDGAGGAVTVGPIGTDGARQVGLVERSDVTVTGRVREEPVSVETSDIPSDELGKWMRSRRGAIQSCYERVLKRNHQLSGRLVVKFTITPRGRVSALDLSEGSLQDPEVAGCIASLAKNWVLPFTPEDEVAVAFPFVFTPST